MQLIGLHGKAGAGKDTFADRLVDRHGFVKRGFADPLYEEVAAAFGVTVAWLRDRGRKELSQDELTLSKCRDDGFLDSILAPGCDIPRSPRWVLQQWGTEYRRAQSDTYWIDQAARFVDSTTAEGVVMPDTRFVNEAAWILGRRGRVINITRQQLASVMPHSSEAELPADMIAMTASNDRDIFHLHLVADYAIGVDCRTT